MLCWWISTFYPWAAKRTLAGSLRATSRYRHGEMGVAVIMCEREYMASFLLETFSKGSSSVESKMTLSLVYFHCWRTVPISSSATCGISVIILPLNFKLVMPNRNLCSLTNSTYVYVIYLNYVFLGGYNPGSRFCGPEG